MSKIYIIAGGTNFPIRPHLALSAPAYGQTGKDLVEACGEAFKERDDEATKWGTHLILTKMAGGRYIGEDKKLFSYDTNEDISALIDAIVADPEVRVLFMPVALCDFDVTDIESFSVDSDRGVVHDKKGVGKDLPRLKTSEYQPHVEDNEWDGKRYISPTLRLALLPSAKIIQKVRKMRKDIFLVGFKTTTGATEQSQFNAGLRLMKESSCNLVLANDIHTRLNMVITPEQAKYAVTTDRGEAIRALVKIAAARCNGTFTRSTVIDGDIVSWNSPEIPDSLRTVVNHCIARGAYKPFMGKTVGHFAAKLGDGKYLTSVRRTNFNDLLLDPHKNGLVKIETQGDDKVVAYGARPSVGGQSQRIIFAEHPGLDCIFHAHVVLRPGSVVPVQAQWPNECGSMQCGKTTSSGLVDFDGIKAVYLENHGPNVVFSKNHDPALVIKFIEDNFDLERSTSGL